MKKHGFFRKLGFISGFLPLAILTLTQVGLASSVQAQPAPAAQSAHTPQSAQAAEAARSRPGGPFGANLFSGTYAGQREDGLNASYQLLPGDRVSVNTWGAIAVNQVFGVDSAGNIFIPGIGPIHVEGIANRDLTTTVRNAIRQVYRAGFGVYTNLLSASPVAVFVTGGVTRPGRYAGIPSDSALFFLDQAGGIDPDSGSFRNIRVLREGVEIAELDLYDFLLRGTLPPVQFTDGDIILVGQRGPSIEVTPPDSPMVSIELLEPQATGADILAIFPQAPQTNAVTIRGVRDGQPALSSVPIAQFAETDIHGGDSLTLRQDLHSEGIVVRLEGDFQGPGEFAVPRGTRLLDLLNHVQIDPQTARADSVYLRRPSVAAEQRRALLDSLSRLERSALLAQSGTAGEAAIREGEAERVRNFVERARQVRPLGRMVTSTAGHQLNILLRDGDVVVIPARTNVVRIVGEVQIPHAVQFRGDLHARDYVQRAGGYSNRAETEAVIVVRANAEVMIASNDTVIHPGDEIIVPPVVDNKFFQNAVDLSQIVYQIAVASSLILRLAL